jgi:hypothetical protein
LLLTGVTACLCIESETAKREREGVRRGAHHQEAGMAYTEADLARRLRISRELLSAHVPRVETKGLEDGFTAAGRTLDIPFPKGLAPQPSQATPGNPSAPLAKADVVVVTYTDDEAKALADVLTPGRFSQDWTHYTHDYESFVPEIRKGAPSLEAGRLGSHWTTTVGKKTVAVVKSELHMHQDVKEVGGKPTLPILRFFQQLMTEAKPSYFFAIGTAGGTLLDHPLGTVAASRSAKFMCEKDFKTQPFANTQYKSDWTIPTAHKAAALDLMKAFTPNLALASTLGDCPCKSLQSSKAPSATFLLDGHDGIPAFFPVLTTDFFEFGTDKNGLDKLGMAVEMDDAVLGLACSTMAKPPRWASVRNYSDPAINASLAMRAEENCAAGIYRRYGYWTSVMSALGTWSIIAGLE